MNILSIEEITVEKRELILEAAFWLMDRWPSRFLKCCRKAGVRHPALNRGKVSIRWFNKAATDAYNGQVSSDELVPLILSNRSSVPVSVYP